MKKNLHIGLWLAVASLATATGSIEEKRLPGDGEVIRFYMAGQWEEAVQESLKTGKPMLIKGVGQIVDKRAATTINEGQC